MTHDMSSVVLFLVIFGTVVALLFGLLAYMIWSARHPPSDC